MNTIACALGQRPDRPERSGCPRRARGCGGSRGRPARRRAAAGRRRSGGWAGTPADGCGCARAGDSRPASSTWTFHARECSGRSAPVSRSTASGLIDATSPARSAAARRATSCLRQLQPRGELGHLVAVLRAVLDRLRDVAEGPCSGRRGARARPCRVRAWPGGRRTPRTPCAPPTPGARSGGAGHRPSRDRPPPPAPARAPGARSAPVRPRMGACPANLRPATPRPTSAPACCPRAHGAATPPARG